MWAQANGLRCNTVDAATEAGRRCVVLLIDRVGVIVAHALTEPTVDAATMGIDLIETVGDEIARVTADAAYETVAFYEAAEMRDATVVVPPSKTARVSRRRPRSRERDRTIMDVRTLGRRRWKKEVGYQLQARVENAFFRYKSIIGIGFAPGPEAGEWPSPWSRVTS